MTWDTDDREWLETDGRGGFASGTVCGIRTRRYHGLLLTATTPPTGRVMLVNGMEAWLVADGRREPITSQRYDGDVRFPDGATRLVAFTHEPWPRWTFRLDSGGTLTQEVLVLRRTGATLVRWTLDASPALASDAWVEVRLLCSGRDYHATHHENPQFDFTVREAGQALALRPYGDGPAIVMAGTGTFEVAPDWYRRFLYTAERDRGLDAIEDLASPGTHRLRFVDGAATLALATTVDALEDDGSPLARRGDRWIAEEDDRRRALGSPLARAADSYLVSRGGGTTIVAGYPWFTDWGRDTFIAVRGLCLATGRLDDAKRILLEWATAVSEGMLPNRFPDRGAEPEFNAVDASLWFIIAVNELERVDATNTAPTLDAHARDALHQACDAIVEGFTRGTRHGIGADVDGLLMAGEPGSQLTWMDARVGDWTVTPRVGKPVEVQALWLNALAIVAARERRWCDRLDLARAAFQVRFWNDDRGCLYDVVDVDHQRGRVDASLRPNQVLAIGGLPLSLLPPDRARRVMDLVERELLTPLGLRSLAPSEPGYTGHYAGDGRRRDAAYHQGTVWPWWIGPFVEAWLRVHGDDADRRDEARRRFVAPFEAHLEAAGLGHVSEILDGDPPFTPRGCPFQAWSLGELIRARHLVDGPGPARE